MDTWIKYCIYWLLSNISRKKKQRMRILGAVIFLNLLAGKLNKFPQNCIFKKLAHAYYKRPYFSKFFGGKIKNFDKGYHESKLQHKFSKHFNLV